MMDGVGPTVEVPQVSLGAGAGAAPLGAVDPTTGPVVTVADTALINGVTSGSVSSDRTRRLAPATQHDINSPPQLITMSSIVNLYDTTFFGF